MSAATLDEHDAYDAIAKAAGLDNKDGYAANFWTCLMVDLVEATVATQKLLAGVDMQFIPEEERPAIEHVAKRIRLAVDHAESLRPFLKMGPGSIK